MSDSQEETSFKVEREGEVSLEVANERKQHGNDLFRAGKWDDALVAYRSALGCLPKRKQMNPSSRRAKTYLKDDEVDNEVDSSTKGKGPEKNYNEEEIVEVATPAVDEAEKEIKQLRAVLNANISACYMKQGNHKEAVDACTEALQDDPKYVKALERRASCNDTLNTWSSLTTAQEDYNKLLTLVSSPSQLFEIRRKLEALKPRQEAAQKRETDEMLSKLKGLGNSILGNFGLSTDNFQFVPNGQGGYSVNFTK